MRNPFERGDLETVLLVAGFFLSIFAPVRVDGLPMSIYVALAIVSWLQFRVIQGQRHLEETLKRRAPEIPA